MCRMVLDDDGGKPATHMRVGPQVVRIGQVTRIEKRPPAYARGLIELTTGPSGLVSY
jgi:hypothetical protein